MKRYFKLFKITKNFCWFQDGPLADAATIALKTSEIKKANINPEYGIVVTIEEADEPIIAEDIN